MHCISWGTAKIIRQSTKLAHIVQKANIICILKTNKRQQMEKKIREVQFLPTRIISEESDIEIQVQINNHRQPTSNVKRYSDRNYDHKNKIKQLQ